MTPPAGITALLTAETRPDLIHHGGEWGGSESRSRCDPCRCLPVTSVDLVGLAELSPQLNLLPAVLADCPTGQGEQGRKRTVIREMRILCRSQPKRY